MIQAKGYSFELVEPFSIEYEELSEDLFQEDLLCVATSRHALIALTKNEKTLIQAKKCRWACIAPTTKEFAESLGLQVVYKAFNAQNLARKIIQKEKGRVLHLKGSDSLNVIENSLKSSGIEIQTRIAYSKEPKTELCLSNAPDAALIFSPNSLKILQEILHLPWETPLYCIGATTAYSAIEMGFVKVHYPKKPDIKKLINLL